MENKVAFCRPLRLRDIHSVLLPYPLFGSYWEASCELSSLRWRVGLGERMHEARSDQYGVRQKMNDTSPPLPDNDEPTPGLREAYRLLTLEVEQLRKAKYEIDAKLDKAEAARDLLCELLADNHRSETKRPVRSPPDGSKPTRHRRGSRTFEIVERSRAALNASGRPLERSELLEKIQESGFQVEGKDPAKIVGRTLWESEDFIHIPKEGYWLKDASVHVREKAES